MHKARAFFYICAGLFLLALGGCSKDKPTQVALPPDPTRVIGTWTDGTLAVVVAPDYTWRFFGEVRYRCTVSGYQTTCSYQGDVSGVVQPGTPYGINNYRRDSYGNIATVSGEWDADFTRLTGRVSVAPQSGVGGSVTFTMQKVGS